MHLNWFLLAILLGVGLAQIPVLMTKKALGFYNTGRPDLCVTWARRALAWPAALPIRVSARHAVGLGLSEQNRLAEAEAEYRQAYQLSSRRPGSDLAARSLTLLATSQANQGQMEEALAFVRQVASWSPAGRRDALVASADWLRVLGRWDEALEALHAARQAPPLPMPNFEMRSQGIVALGLAWTEASASQARGDRAAADRAWAWLEQAQRAFPGDKKLQLWCDATAAWLLALRGQPADAARVSAQTRAGLAEFAQSRGTQQNGLSMLGRAAYLIGDYAEGKRLWTEFLDTRPTRPSETRGLYYLGECLRLSGEGGAAERAYRQAVSLGVETYYVRCAEGRLTELGLPAEPRPQKPVPPETVWPPPPRGGRLAVGSHQIERMGGWSQAVAPSSSASSRARASEGRPEARRPAAPPQPPRPAPECARGTGGTRSASAGPSGRAGWYSGPSGCRD